MTGRTPHLKVFINGLQKAIEAIFLISLMNIHIENKDLKSSRPERLQPVQDSPSIQEPLSAQDIANWPVAKARPDDADGRAPLHAALKHLNLDGPLQMAGRHFAMGCVALEITQRCNLDCTLCYLSEKSEAVKDLPLVEIFRRIDRIRHDYGPHTNIQITGGDPTLRKREELIEIIAYASRRELRPALFTNGIKATRSLLKELAAAGLRDIAFHVDMTQQRKGYANEIDLNTIRREYIDRAEGLGLHIFFNTTIFDGNLHEIEKLTEFFIENADNVHLCSFQLQAETGRGTMEPSHGSVTIENVIAQLNKGADIDLGFDWPRIGHPSCNRYGTCLTAGNEITPLFDAPGFFAEMFPKFENIRLDRHHMGATYLSLARLFMSRPDLLIKTTAFALGKIWTLRRGLLKSRGRINKLTFYIHNFMDAKALERDRCESCVFMTMTRDGPISMCVHNAKRDDFILQPVETKDGRKWHPLAASVEMLPTKKLKGRTRRQRLTQTFDRESK